MQCLETWFSGILGSTELMARLNDLRGFSNRNDSMILQSKPRLGTPGSCGHWQL